MPDEITRAVLDNQPLPLRDIESVPAGLFREQAALELASYLEESAALARATGSAEPPLSVLLPADPATHRYTVAIAEARDGSERGRTFEAPGVKLNWSRESSASARSAAVVAVDRNAGARDQFDAAIRRAIPAASIAGAADLDPSAALVASIGGALKIAAGAKLGFDYSQVREAAGKLAGDVGLRVATGIEASLEASIDGSFVAFVTLDDRRRLRVRVFQKNRAGLAAAAQLAVAARAGELPGGPVELAAALLGLHHEQWLESVAREAASGADAIAARIGANAAAVSRFFERWRRMEAHTAEAIWNAAGSAALARIGEWARRAAAELETPAAFGSALAGALAADPNFADSPEGLWMDSVAGGLLSAVVDPNRFRALVKAGAAASALLNDADAAAALEKLKEYAARELDVARLERLVSLEGLDEWVQRQLNVNTAERASEKIRAAMNAARAICEKAAAALEKKYSAELAYRMESGSSGTALIDCSFEFTPEGLALYRECLAGDFSRVLGVGARDVTLRQAVLTHGIRRRISIELHVPFLGHAEWGTDLEALARLEIEAGDDGRLFAYTMAASDRLEKKNAYQSVLALAGSVLAGTQRGGDFTLAFTDRQTLPRGRARTALGPVLSAYGFDSSPEQWLERLPESARNVEASLTLSLPGSAGACWLRGPAERDAQFFPVYAAVSVAVQRAMRKWLPLAWFADTDRYDDLGAAFPLLVYQALPPFPGKPRSEFAYDAMSLESARLGRRTVVRNLTAQLETIRPLLDAAGKRRTGRFYSPYEAPRIIASVIERPRQFLSLLSADAVFIDSLVNLGVRGSGLAGVLERDPATAVRQLAAFSGRLVTAFHRKLRRLYGGRGFVSFGSLLFLEATRALGAALSADVQVAAVLRLSAGEATQTFVNAAFRP